MNISLLNAVAYGGLPDGQIHGKSAVKTFSLNIL